MEPRLPQSRKNTEFPPDYIRIIEDVIQKNFRKITKTHSVHVRGRIYQEEILTQIGFREKGSIRQVNFEASVDYNLKPNNIMDQIYISIDALGAMIQQYFDADGDIEMPKEWHGFDLEGKKVFLKMSGENPDLEEQANELLRKTGGDVPNVDIIEAVQTSPPEDVAPEERRRKKKEEMN